MVKAIFLDIDGTLISFKTHIIPQSTIEALSKAKEKGIKIFIATGRPPLIITSITSINHLVDGYISTNGAFCYFKEQVYQTCAINKNDVKLVMDRCNELKTPVVIASATSGIESMAVVNRNEMYNELFVNLLNIRNIPDDDRIAKELLKKPIIQLTAFIDAQEEMSIMKQLPNCISGRWHEEFTDITAINADKAKGLEATCNVLGISAEETMAFGDGGNDISILIKAGIGVAMGNADDQVKAAADYITTDVDDDGIFNALSHFNII